MSQDILVIGEAVNAVSLASCLESSTGKGTLVLCPTEAESSLLREKDLRLHTENEIRQAMEKAKTVIADPLYRPICPAGVHFIPLPSEAFSGRLFRSQIPNLVEDINSLRKEVL